MLDFVFPNNNEEEFINMASKLDYNELCLIYPDKKQTPRLKEKTKKLQEKTKIRLLLGANLKKPPQKKPDIDYSLLMSGNKNQSALEQGHFDILFNTETSALNHILCKLAKKNKISLAFSFSNILRNKTKTRLIHNIKTNLQLCKKYRIDIILASFASSPYKMRNHHDLKSFFSVVTK